MNEDIPPNAPELEAEEIRFERQALNAEAELLDRESTIEAARSAEAWQVVWLRWIVSFFGITVLCGLAYLLQHVVEKLFWGPFVFAPTAFAVAAIIAPITAITAISTALIIGAFRKYEDKDAKTLGEQFKSLIPSLSSG